jgi:Helix-turn-helix domain
VSLPLEAADHRLLDTADAAELLSVSPQYLTDLRSKGTSFVPFVRVSRGAIRYRLGDLVQFINSRTERQTADEGRSPKRVEVPA